MAARSCGWLLVFSNATISSAALQVRVRELEQREDAILLNGFCGSLWRHPLDQLRDRQALELAQLG